MVALLHRLQRAEAPAQAAGGQGVQGELFIALARCPRAPLRVREHVPGSPAQPPVAARQSDGCRPAAHAHETMREGTVAAVRSPLRVGARPVT
jgi:hypothetical protein